MLIVFTAISVSSITLGALAAAPGFKDEAPCRVEDLNKCGADFLIYSTYSQVPITPEKQRDACMKELASAECTRQFANACASGVVRGVNLVTMQNVIDQLEGKCAMGSPAHVRYLQNAPCINKAGADIHKCVTKYLEDIHSIAEFTPKKDKSGYNCCRHYIFEDCARKALDTKCKNAAAKHSKSHPLEEGSKSFTSWHRRYFEDILESTMGELVGLACRKYRRTSDKCAKEFSRQKLRKVDTKGKTVNLLVPLTTIIHSAVV